MQDGTPAIFFKCWSILCFCTLPDVRHPKRYKIQGGTPAIFCWGFGAGAIIQTLPQISMNFAPISEFFLYFCGGGASGRWEPPAAQSRFLDDFLWIWVSWRGAWRGTLGVILEPGSQIGVIMLTFWLSFSGVGKMSENGAPQGGGWTCDPFMPAHVS